MPDSDQKYPPRVLVIIPAYNEEKSVVSVAEQAKASYPNVDVLVINDKSTDRTEQVLREHRINHISLPTNLGIGGAVQTGFMYARDHGYDIAIQVDGDGQHPPQQIPTLIDALLEKQDDFVIGSRYLHKQQIVSSRARWIGGGVLSGSIFLLTRKLVTDPTSGFRAYSRKVIEYTSWSYPQEYPEPISVIELLENGFTMVEVPVQMKEREFGKSSITGLKTMFYMIKVIFAIFIAKLRRGRV